MNIKASQAVFTLGIIRIVPNFYWQQTCAKIRYTVQVLAPLMRTSSKQFPVLPLPLVTNELLVQVMGKSQNGKTLEYILCGQ